MTNNKTKPEAHARARCFVIAKLNILRKIKQNKNKQTKVCLETPGLKHTLQHTSSIGLVFKPARELSFTWGLVSRVVYRQVGAASKMVVLARNFLLFLAICVAVKAAGKVECVVSTIK